MNKLQKQLEKLGSEKGTLQRERSELQKQCSELAGAVDKLNKDKVRVCVASAAAGAAGQTDTAATVRDRQQAEQALQRAGQKHQ
jgi:hypothetical protein